MCQGIWQCGLCIIMFLNNGFQHQAIQENGFWVWKQVLIYTEKTHLQLLCYYTLITIKPYNLILISSLSTGPFPFAFICVLLLYSSYSHCCSLLPLCFMLLENIINAIPNGFLACRVWPLGRMKTRSIANKLLLREMVLKHTGLEN